MMEKQFALAHHFNPQALWPGLIERLFFVAASPPSGRDFVSLGKGHGGGRRCANNPRTSQQLSNRCDSSCSLLISCKKKHGYHHHGHMRIQAASQSRICYSQTAYARLFDGFFSSGFWDSRGAAEHFFLQAID
jgi:murein endopeptidase